MVVRCLAYNLFGHHRTVYVYGPGGKSERCNFTGCAISVATARFRRLEVSELAITAGVPGDERDSDGRPSRATEPAVPDLNPLQRLIRQRLQEQGWSYGDVAKRGGLPRSTVYTLATTRNLARPPRPATLNGLAWGLDLPVSVVRSAAAESTGLHYYDDEPGGPGPASDPERDLLIASIDELTAEDRRHVAALVESLRKQAPQERPGR
jgi:transcriptional regulator with XRE-family HTH domain